MPVIRIKDINAGVSLTPASFIFEAENKYKRKIDEIIARLNASGAHILLIAGPSGSGKTTTASLIARGIESSGREAVVISLDDFYRDITDPAYPRNSMGEPDFESVHALDLQFIESTLLSIAQNRPFLLPRFDFESSSRSAVSMHPPIDGGVVIIEGLHALNPLISLHLPDGSAYKVFISVSTNVEDDDGVRIISGRKLRFIRRMVRDSIYRATSPKETLKLWGGVLDGEIKYLYPTRVYADVEFNTFHSYELSLMRPFVQSLVTEDMAEESDLFKTVLNAVSLAEPIDVGMLPEDSLLREFVPAT